MTLRYLSPGGKITFCLTHQDVAKYHVKFKIKTNYPQAENL